MIIIKLIKSINIMEDKKLVIKLNVLSGLILFIQILVMMGIAFIFNFTASFQVSFTKMLLVIVLFMILLFIHELIHGFFFKRFSDHKKIKYGFKSGMLYAANPGVLYPKKQFMIIVLAPFVIITLLLLLLFIFGIAKAGVLIIFILHTSGCVGDFWFLYELYKNPSVTHCEDTPVGIKLFKKTSDLPKNFV